MTRFSSLRRIGAPIASAAATAFVFTVALWVQHARSGWPFAPVSQGAAPNAAPPAASPAGGQPKDDQQAAADDAKKTEAYWRDRVAKARADLDRAKTFADALQSRINALTTDFAARSDPAQRAQIGNDRQKALAELDRVKKEIEANTKAIADIQEEARKAGVPAGWVR